MERRDARQVPERPDGGVREHEGNADRQEASEADRRTGGVRIAAPVEGGDSRAEGAERVRSDRRQDADRTEATRPGQGTCPQGRSMAEQSRYFS